MKTAEIIIPTKQYSNIKFHLDYETEEDLDQQIKHLWLKYYNFFEFEKNLVNDKGEKHKLDFVEDLQKDFDEEHKDES